jgi:hypothetical protein
MATMRMLMHHNNTPLQTVALIALILAGPACDTGPGPDAAASSAAASSGGVGGSGSTSATAGGGGSAAQPCENSGDCDGHAGLPVCNVEVCRFGFCAIVFDAFGTLCGDPSDICDGEGRCGEWLPPGATSCFQPKPLPASCPLCDDGNPATHDTCERSDAGSEQDACTHVQARDGFACGPNYVVSNGQCCPK